MFKFKTAILKELKILFADKVGLAFMFFMPVALVIIISIIQDSAFNLINNQNVEILVSNQDNDELSLELIELINQSGMFKVNVNNNLDSIETYDLVMKGKDQLAVFIPENFTNSISLNAKSVARSALTELGMDEGLPKLDTNYRNNGIHFFYAPVLQESIKQPAIGIVQAQLRVLENKTLIDEIYRMLEVEPSENIADKYMAPIEQVMTKGENSSLQVNSTQHNVPSWTIFAMFFMVVSLGSNIVSEKINGSFIRLKSMPSSFAFILSSKVLTYLIAAFLQVFVIWGIAFLLFPIMGLPPLTLPGSIGLTMVSLFIIAMAAISYAVMIGTFANTKEQANGIGASSIIIFAAIGGLWIPVFIMPVIFRTISKISPLHWCLEAFYKLFLGSGTLAELLPVYIVLLLFIFACFTISFIGLKIKNLV